MAMTACAVGGAAATVGVATGLLWQGKRLRLFQRCSRGAVPVTDSCDGVCSAVRHMAKAQQAHNSSGIAAAVGAKTRRGHRSV